MYTVVTMQLTNYRDCDQGIEIIYLLLNDRDRGGMFICITIRARYVWWNHRNRSDVVTRLQRSYNYQDHHDIRDPSRHAMTFTRNWRCLDFLDLWICRCRKLQCSTFGEKKELWVYVVFSPLFSYCPVQVCRYCSRVPILHRMYLGLNRTAMMLLRSLSISPMIFHALLDVLRRLAYSGISSRA